MRRIRPHVVLTFGPDGGLTGHVDHAMAGVFATMAFEWAGRPDRFPEQTGAGTARRIARRSCITSRPTSCYLIFRSIAPPTVTARIEVGAERFEKKDRGISTASNAGAAV